MVHSNPIAHLCEMHSYVISTFSQRARSHHELVSYGYLPQDEASTRGKIRDYSEKL